MEVGCAVSIVDKDGIRDLECSGYRNLEKRQAVDCSTQFMIASISKIFTAVGILQLYEQQKIDLDVDINEYLDCKVIHPTKLPITTRQLLQHHGGLKDDESGLIKWKSTTDSLYPLDLGQHVKERFCEKGKQYSPSDWNKKGPGYSYHYSNAGFTLLGYLIEQVSGKNFIDFMKESLFDRLGLHSASWSVPSNDHQVAVPYNSRKESLGNYCVAEYPACQLRISIEDLSKLLRFFICEGEINGVRMLQKETIEMMCPSSFREGLGWWGKDAIYGKKFQDVWIHGGFMAGVRTQINFYPQYQVGFLLLCNDERNYSSIEKYLEEEKNKFATIKTLK